MKRRGKKCYYFNKRSNKQICDKHFIFSDSSNSNKVDNKFKGEMTLTIGRFSFFSDIKGGD